MLSGQITAMMAKTFFFKNLAFKQCITNKTIHVFHLALKPAAAPSLQQHDCVCVCLLML